VETYEDIRLAQEHPRAILLAGLSALLVLRSYLRAYTLSGASSAPTVYFGRKIPGESRCVRSAAAVFPHRALSTGPIPTRRHVFADLPIPYQRHQARDGLPGGGPLRGPRNRVIGRRSGALPCSRSTATFRGCRCKQSHGIVRSSMEGRPLVCAYTPEPPDQSRKNACRLHSAPINTS